MRYLSLLKSSFNNCFKKLAGASALLLGLASLGNAQISVSIGSGTTTSYNIPVNTLYNYSYTQQILLSSEIGMSGVINKIRFAYNTGTMFENDDWTVYMGYKASNIFNSTTDWVPLANLTQVYSGMIATPTASGYTIELTLSAPFNYDMNLGNLVIAIDENSPGYEYTSDIFPMTVAANRSIYYRSDGTNPDPSSPPTGTRYGYHNNIQLEIMPNNVCVAPLVGGTATSSIAIACPTENFLLNVSGGTVASGIAYQWQYSTSGLPGTWVDIAGANTFSYNQTHNAASIYRRRIICTAAADTAYSSTVFVDINPFYNCYCTSAATNTGDEDIVKVKIGTWENSSPANCDTYTDFTALAPPALFQGITYAAQVDVGDCTPSFVYSNGAVIFIDFNQNGSFNDPGERAFASPILPGGLPASHIGSFTIPVSALTGITRMRVIGVEGSAGATISACGTYSWGETEDYLVNIQPQPANEVSLISIDNPIVSTCSFNNALDVTVRNNGTDTLNSITFDVNTGGLVQTAVWTGSIAPNFTQSIVVPGVFAYNDGDSLTVTASLPNGVADLILTDNTLGLRHYLALQGVYKVGYGVNSTDTIADIPTALARLDLRGICDTVYFDLKSGIYNGRYTITDYPGWTSGLKVVFRSETGNAADVILTDSATSSATNFIFNLDGGDGIGFESVTLRQRSATYRTILNVKNGAHELFVNNSRLLCDTSLTGSTTGTFDQIIIRSADGTTDHNATITNNFLQGGVRAINLGAATNEIEKQHIIRNNIIKNISYVGILVAGTENAIVENNEVYLAPYSTLSTSFGLYYLNTIKGGSISGNNVQLPRLGVPINLDNAKGGVDPLYVRNNFVYSGDSTTTTGSYGVLVQNVGSTHINITNNSIAHYSNSAAIGAITVLDGNSVSILNNNIGSFKLSPGIKVDKAYSLVESNNNNIYQANGGNVVSYTNTPYATIADFTTATGYDAASISVNPGFTGSDLHTCQLALNGAAMPLPYVTTDIDGDARSSTPDIGADEFMGDAGDLLAADAIDKCTNESVSLGNAPLTGATYLWSTGAATSSINTTTAGQFIVTASTACGSFSDTVTVSNIPNPTAGFTLNGIGLTAMLTNTSTNALGYSWNFGDGNTSTLANPNHVYTTGGVYVITLTVYGECDTVTTTQTYNAIAVGNEELSIMDVSLYPNPATDNVNIALSESLQDVSLHIFDVTGKQVYSTSLESTSLTITVPVNNLTTGMYTIVIKSDSMSRSMKFVKK